MKFLDYFQFIIVLFMTLLQLSRTFYDNDTTVKLRYSRHASNNDLTKVEFPLNGENITLNLKKSYLIGTKTPVWLLREDYRNSFIDKTDPFTIGNAIQFYVDEDKNASIAVVTGDEDEKEFMGMYGRWFMSPVYRSKSFKRKHRSIDNKNLTNIYSSKVSFTDLHTISEISKFKFTKSINTLLRRRRKLLNKNNWREHINSKEARETQEQSTVYPEILVIADYNMKFSKLNNPRFYKFLMYLIVFWNSVDLRFRELKDPKIRLHISGIVVAVNYESVPFFQSNLDGKLIKATSAMQDMSYWLSDHRKTFPIKSFDITVAMTNLPLCTNYDSQCLNTAITGITRKIGGDCPIEWSPFSFLTAIIHDKLDFGGILRATHEIGHIFGADHDGSQNNKECPDSDDNIMASNDDYAPTKNIWSKCSKQSISKFFKKNGLDCFRNIERFKDAGDNIFSPISLLDQCNSRGFMYACDPSPRTCQALFCKNSGWRGITTVWSCTNTGSAVDGSPCGKGVCRNHQCIRSKHPLSSDFGHVL